MTDATSVIWKKDKPKMTVSIAFSNPNQPPLVGQRDNLHEAMNALKVNLSHLEATIYQNNKTLRFTRQSTTQYWTIA